MGNASKLHVSDTIWQEWNEATRETARLMWRYRDHRIVLTTNPQGLAEAIKAANYRLRVKQ